MVEWRGFYAGLIWVMAPHAFRLLHAPRLKFCNATQSCAKCKMQQCTAPMPHLHYAVFGLINSKQVATLFHKLYQLCSTNSRKGNNSALQSYAFCISEFLSYYSATIVLEYSIQHVLQPMASSESMPW